MHFRTDRQTRLKAKIFNALADSDRLKILEFIRANEKCVCEIIPYVGLIQPVVSRHLKILKDSGLVRDRKDGAKRLYSITDRKIFDIIDAATPELMNVLSKRIIEQIA